LAKNTAVLAAYNTTADEWDSTNPAGNWQLRRLVIAYMANKIANPVKAATYLAKIKALADLGGSWGKLLYSVNDGVGNNTLTVTSPGANFLTGCGGQSCLGNVLSIDARAWNIVGVPNANTLVLSDNNPPPNGNNLRLRIFPVLAGSDLGIALIYDWLYNDLDEATRTAFMNQLDVLCTLWAENYIGLDASPYNDVFYVRQGPSGLVGALAIYPDHPNSLKHIKFMSDVWFNVLMPVWKQVFGPEGGGWHESWSDYIRASSGYGLTSFLVPSLLSWQAATGDPILTRESWVKNFAYLTMYMTRPDYLMESIGDTSRAYLIAESPALGSLNGLAEIYNDPVLRGWARVVNNNQPSAALDGFEPSAWPFYKPDNKANPVASRSALPAVRNFTGWGLLSMRTGWTEDDTSVTFKYGDNFWSHEHFDTGAFTIFSRGLLALDSGSYRSGSLSKHENQYARQTIAHNTLTVTDPADYYPGTTFLTYSETGGSLYLAPPNDGGQRRVGTLYNQRFPQFESPDHLGHWLKNFDYYHMGKMTAFASTPGYTYTAVDITNAYNNKYSATTPNATNRTYRVKKAIRHLLFVPRGSAAYVIVFDQVTSTNASFTKRWLLHTVNQPSVVGNRFEIVRNELVTSLPFVDLWPVKYKNELKYASGVSNNLQYKYDGKLYGWMVQPAGGSINLVGGPGKEFWVEDPQNPGTGTNWNQCMQGQCAAQVEGLGPVENFIHPDPGTAPHEAGSWRIEVKPGTPATDDFFLHVMLATTTGDTSLPTNVTSPGGLPADKVGATWVDGGKTYTVIFPKDGLGGHISIGGVVDEDLLEHAQPLPDEVQIDSGSGQSGAADSLLAAPFQVVVKDSAGSAVPGATVHFAIAQGNGYLSSDTAVTDASGRAGVTLRLGSGPVGSAVKVLANINGVAPVEFSATLGSGGATGASLASLSCTPGSLVSGEKATCSVSLSQVAGTGGVTIALSSNALSLTVPATVQVAAGLSDATFTATAGSILSTLTAVVTGTYNGVSKTASISLLNGTPVLTGVTCAPTSIASGGTASCTVTLSAAGTGGTTIALSSDTPSVTVPVAVSIPAGSPTATFAAKVGTISSALTAVVSATLLGVSRTVSLTLVPAYTGGTPIPTGRWVMIPTRGLPVQTVGYEKLVYAPSPVSKAVMLGNYQQLSTEPNQAIIAYDFDTNYWSVVDIGSNFHTENMPEAGHSIGGFSYNSNQRSFIYYCCGSGSNQPETLYNTYWYDFFGQSGRHKQASPKPGTLQYHSSAFDTVNNRYVTHGGNSWAGTWTYDPDKNSYEQKTARGTPPNPHVNLPCMTYNSSDKKVYLFGGQIGAGFSNELFTYDTAANTWTKLAPSGTPPSPRWRCGMDYDSTNNVFLMYGGKDQTRVYNDSWIYDPAANSWTQITPEQSPPMDGEAAFENLAYDSDHNVFILVLRGLNGYADGVSGKHAAQTWFFRYKGSGPNAGMVTPEIRTTPGSINQNLDGWAKEPSLISTGDKLYAAWVETGRPFERTSAQMFHVFAKEWSDNGSWVSLGGSPTSLDSEFSNYNESHSPSIAVIGGKPWISWYKWNNSGEVWGLWAKSWNGSAWEGGRVGRVGKDPAKAFQGRSQMADVSGVPYVAFIEVDKTFFPPKNFIYVKYWDGDRWTLQGTGPLNRNLSANTTVTSVSLASDGTTPYVAWTEYTSDAKLQNQTPTQVYVSRWSGSQWTSVGESLNVDRSASARDVALIIAVGQPYAAWTEATTMGNAQVFVKTLSGGSWTSVGPSTLNRDTSTGWAYRPSLAADSSGAVFVAWVEQQALGKRAQTYVSKFASGAWISLGDSLNADPALGSAQKVSLAVVDGNPVAAWGEVNYGALRQIYLKRWNGSGWTLLSGGSGTKLPSCDVNRDGKVDVLDVQLAINQVGLVGCTADLQPDGRCDVVDVLRIVTAVLSGSCKVGP
jgi:hypothetical protein